MASSARASAFHRRRLHGLRPAFSRVVDLGDQREHGPELVDHVGNDQLPSVYHLATRPRTTEVESRLTPPSIRCRWHTLSNPGRRYLRCGQLADALIRFLLPPWEGPASGTHSNGSLDEDSLDGGRVRSGRRWARPPFVVCVAGRQRAHVRDLRSDHRFSAAEVTGRSRGADCLCV
jgi:hypothetical protein